jgi:hypothetical protein
MLFCFSLFVSCIILHHLRYLIRLSILWNPWEARLFRLRPLAH